MKKERVRTKRGFKGLGMFILGWFIGFICTLGMVVGLGYWAYTSITIRRVEKWTKSNITNNEGIEDLTLQKAMAIAQGIYSNGNDAYTLNKLEDDFGVVLLDDTLYGIDLGLIKNSPILNLGQAIDDTIDTATFNNVLSFIGVDEDELGLLNTLLNKEMVYYVANGKIYSDEDHNIEVGFKYSVDGNIVKFANGTHTVASGVIRPRLMDMPLYATLTSMNEAAQSLKLYEVMEYHYNANDGKYYQNFDGTNYTGEVSGVIANLAEYTIGELSTKEDFDDIRIYEVMGYYFNEDDGKYYQNFDGTTYSNEVTGIITHLADAKVNELSNRINTLTLGEVLGIDESDATGVVKALFNKNINNLDAEIDNLQIYQILGYYYNEADHKYYQNKDGETYYNQVTGIMGAIASSKVNEIGTTINNLKAKDVFDVESTSILKLFTQDELNNLNIIDLPTQVANKINSVSIDYLVANQIITGVDTGTDYYQGIKNFTLVQLLNGTGE